MTHSNPLLQKYEELYGKKEEPKVIKTDELVTVEQLDDAFKNWASSTSIKGTQIGYTYTDEITKPPTLKSYDLDDLKVSFFQVAGQLQTGKAQVVSMNMEFGDHMNKITFEVYVYKP
jgi:nitric oxide reductase large subunit